MNRIITLLVSLAAGLTWVVSASSFTATLTQYGQMEGLLTDSVINNTDTLYVTGPFGLDDWGPLKMACRSGSIKVLDMRQAEVEGAAMPPSALEYTQLHTVLLSENLKSIGRWGLAFSPQLMTVVLPEELELLGEMAFEYCRNLRGTPMEIPAGVQSIGMACFHQCDSLEEILLHEGIREIGAAAFQHTGLREINLPEGLDSIGNGAFVNSWLKSVAIPSSCSRMGSAIFMASMELTEATVEDGPEIIPSGFMTGCVSLRSLSLPPSVRTVKFQAFMGCPIEELVLSEGLEVIEYGAFESMTADSITLPSTLKFIGKNALSPGLKAIRCNAEVPPMAYDEMSNADIFIANIPRNIPVYVPAESVEAYRRDLAWGRFTNIIGMGTDAIDSPAVTERSAAVTARDGALEIALGDGMTDSYGVFTSDGRCVGSGTVSGTARVALAPGLYIVRVGSASFKVRL